MFLTPLDVRAVPPDLWQLLAPLIWDDTVSGGAFGRLEFRAGLITDLASIPRLLRRHNSFDPNGPSRRPAVGHDDMYATAKAAGKPITRDQADAFLHAALLAEGVSRPVAWMFYRGVRLGGWMVWRDYRKADKDSKEPVVPR